MNTCDPTHNHTMSNARARTPLTLLSVAAATMLASSAWAQVAPPPPPPPQPEPEFVPPSEPPAPVTRPGNEAERRATGSARVGVNTPAVDVGAGAIPSLKYNKMAQEGDDGKIVRVRIPLHYQALQNNPTVGILVAEQLDRYLIERRVRFEELLFANYADLELLESGLLEDLNIFDTEALTAASLALKNLVGPTTLTQELQSKGVLTPMQARFSNHLVREYEQDVRKEIERDFGESAINEQLKFMYDTALQEARDARDGMLLESLTRLDAVFALVDQFVPDASLSAEQREAISALSLDSFEGINQEDVLRDAMLVLQTWDTEQQRAFLQGAANSRANRLSVPMVMIDITAGKKVTFNEPPTATRASDRAPGAGQNAGGDGNDGG